MAQVYEREQNIKKGFIYGIFSTIFFAIMAIFVKAIGEKISTSELLFFRFAISLVILIPFVFMDKDFSFKIQDPFGYLLRILAALFSLFCLFFALKFLPLVDALLLNNTSPLFVPILVWLMRGVKTPKKAVLGTLIGFLGVGVILKPGNEIFTIESLIALASGFFSALAMIQLRLLSKTSPITQMLFYYFLVSTLISGLVSLMQWQTPASTKLWIMIVCVGLFGTLFQVFATLTYANAPVRLMAPLIFLVVVFAGFFDWIIWGNFPDYPTIFGAVLVIIGAIITVHFGRKELDKIN